MRISRVEIHSKIRVREDWYIGPSHPTKEAGFYTVWITTSLRTWLKAKVMYQVWDKIHTTRVLSAVFLREPLWPAIEWIEKRMDLADLVGPDNCEYVPVTEQWARENFRWDSIGWESHDSTVKHDDKLEVQK